jgi:hypothetical protein
MLTNLKENCQVEKSTVGKDLKTLAIWVEDKNTEDGTPLLQHSYKGTENL